jgi:hypothetical protein
MHLRREEMYFYLSSLLEGKMPCAFDYLLEREFVRYSAERRCKIAFALPVGLSLSQASVSIGNTSQYE